jgi:hypothetical protein
MKNFCKLVVLAIIAMAVSNESPPKKKNDHSVFWEMKSYRLKKASSINVIRHFFYDVPAVLICKNHHTIKWIL